MKALIHKGFSSFYALVTNFYTYPEPTPGQPAAGSQRLQEGVHFLFRFLACKRWVIAQQLVDHLLAEQLVDHFLAHLLRQFRWRLGLVFRWIRIADPGRPLPE